MKLVFTKAAQDDLETIGDQAALYSPARAGELIRALRHGARQIVDFPHAFQQLDIPGAGPLRRRVVDKHLIVYRIEANGVVVVRVIHGAMELGEHLFLET